VAEKIITGFLEIIMVPELVFFDFATVTWLMSISSSSESSIALRVL
jgi:hypothetical protein